MGELIVTGIALLIIWSAVKEAFFIVFLVIALFGLISIPISRKWPLNSFFEGALLASILCVVIAFFSLGLTGTFNAEPSTIFWAICIPVLGGALVVLRIKADKLEKSCEKGTREMLDFAEAFSHFLPNTKRHFDLYYDNKEKCVLIFLFARDARVAQDACARLSLDEPYIRKFLFGEFVPTEKAAAICNTLLIFGKSYDEKTGFDFGEDSLMHYYRLSGVSAEQLKFITRRIWEEYPTLCKRSRNGMFTMECK